MKNLSYGLGVENSTNIQEEIHDIDHQVNQRSQDHNSRMGNGGRSRTSTYQVSKVRSAEENSELNPLILDCVQFSLVDVQSDRSF